MEIDEPIWLISVCSDRNHFLLYFSCSMLKFVAENSYQHKIIIGVEIMFSWYYIRKCWWNYINNSKGWIFHGHPCRPFCSCIIIITGIQRRWILWAHTRRSELISCLRPGEANKSSETSFGFPGSTWSDYAGNYWLNSVPWVVLNRSELDFYRC